MIKCLNSIIYRKEMKDILDINKNKLLNISDKVTKDLIMIYLNKNTFDINYWIDDIYLKCHNVIKNVNNKYPDKDFIYWYLWGYYQDSYHDHIDNEIKSITEDQNKFISPPLRENLYRFITQYYIWFSKELNDKGYVNIEEMKNKINQLLNTYFII